ncbi:UNVERIFIED_CONTAM: Homeobox-leucine zipper protein ATHB-17 [Sesamum radiatum]|uniref:Homeobox-leucine zipper protein ATHB-17 n=1 Tax=Sesamum radiatum TaxID=300843 RepID=A0AAW2TXD1_SESRA
MAMKSAVDINQVPSSGTEDECMEEEDEISPNHGGPTPRKKLRLTKEQARLLEESFKLNHTLNPKQKEALAEQLNLKPRQVEVWFQNRRARSKLKQTEMECEYLKRWFGSLTEQNRKLHKEVEELRAMKVAAAATTTTLRKSPTTTTAAAATTMPFRQPPASCYN